MKTAVEWLIEAMYQETYPFNPKYSKIFEQAKEMEKQRMIDLVQQLKDYTRESNNVLGFDEREASEFVEIFYNETFKSE
jgi:hemoglobin-like flavoprotein